MALDQLVLEIKFTLSIRLFCDPAVMVCKEGLFISGIEVAEENPAAKGTEEGSTGNSSLGAWLVIVRVLLNDCDLLTADETARAKGDGLELEYGFGTAKVLRVFRFNGAGGQEGKLKGLLLLTGEVEDSVFFPSSTFS